MADGYVYADGSADLGFQRIGGPGDTVKPGEGLLYFIRNNALLAAALLEKLEQL
jgi:hypothetical protein